MPRRRPGTARTATSSPCTRSTRRSWVRTRTRRRPSSASTCGSTRSRGRSSSASTRTPRRAERGTSRQRSVHGTFARPRSWKRSGAGIFIALSISARPSRVEPSPPGGGRSHTGGGPDAGHIGAERELRAAVYGDSEPSRRPGAPGQGGGRAGPSRTADARCRGGHAGAPGDQAVPVRTGAVPKTSAVVAAGGAGAGPAPVRVLRAQGDDGGSCGAQGAGRPGHLAEHGGGVRGGQPPQGGPDSGGGRDDVAEGSIRADSGGRDAAGAGRRGLRGAARLAGPGCRLTGHGDVL
ncbi:exported hypothetical protein [Streptomyces misionensis JCM 4497]